jgi:hypothetical protein
MRTVQDLGGWAKIEMVVRYSHVTTAGKAEAVEKLVRNSNTLFTTPLGATSRTEGVSA